MPARQFVRLVKESSFGTPKTSPTAGVDAFYLRLDGSNQFTPLMTPVIGIIPSGGGRNTPACFYKDKNTLAGNVQGNLYPSQTELLLGWATTPINDARDAPWATTDSTGAMPVNDLASISAYNAILEASTYKRRRASGLKANSFTIQGDRANDKYTFNAAVTGIRDDTNGAGAVAAPDATEFPAPTDADYPCNPWLFSHTAGGLKIGSSRTLFDAVSITFTNSLQPVLWETSYASMIGFFGRTITIEVGMYRKPSPDDLASFRSLSALDVEITLFDGTRTLTMDFGPNNRWTAMNEDLPLDSPYRWTGTITNAIDPATGVDFSFTYDDGEA